MTADERQARKDYYDEVHAIFEALEQAGHDFQEASWKRTERLGDRPYPRHQTEYPWHYFDYRQGPEPFDTRAVTTYGGKTWDSFGQFRIVAKIEGTELGYHTDWSGPRAMIFEQVSTGRCFRITGKNTSHIGENWEYPAISEVTPTQRTMTVWEVVER